MKILIAVLLLAPSTLFAGTISRVDDGILKFAYGQVGSTVTWDVGTHDSMVLDCVGNCTAVSFSPTKFEIMLSTTFKFSNYSGYVAAKSMSGSELDSVKEEMGKKEKLKHFKVETKTP